MTLWNAYCIGWALSGPAWIWMLHRGAEGEPGLPLGEAIVAGGFTGWVLMGLVWPLFTLPSFIECLAEERERRKAA